MREETGGIFRQTIELRDDTGLTGDQIKTVAAEVIEDGFNVVPYFDNNPYFVMGRVGRAKVNVILSTGRDDSPNPLLWDGEKYYRKVIVCDGLWDDDFFGTFTDKSPGNKTKNERLIKDLQKLADALSEKLNQRALQPSR